MSHAVDLDQFGSRAVGRRVASAFDGDQRIIDPVDHRNRHRQLLEFVPAVSRGKDRGVLAGKARGVNGPVEIGLSLGAQFLFGDREGGRADDLVRVDP